MKVGKDIPDGLQEQMLERITNVLTELHRYRARNMNNMRIEAILTQLEHIEATPKEGKRLSFREKEDFDFNLIEGTLLEGNESLERELQSIRNFAQNAL